MLERTAGQTLWWLLGHWVTVATVAAALLVAVIVASAVAAGSDPATDGTIGTQPSSEVTTGGSNESADVAITLTCGAGALLTLTATGVGELQLTVDGPARTHASGVGTVTASLTGPAGQYSARFTATGPIDRISWTSMVGVCSE